ncbi:MAG: amidohydrolase family protein [Acidimicrobiales bacterium]
MFDVVIRGGEVVDGTGAPRRRADVAIMDGRIVRIGRVDGEAATVIDATGKVVTPGFVDVHTHIDAQAFWDPALTPSSLHGVTTVFAGNCGFSIAPLSDDPADADYLLRMLARVEGMPTESLRLGVPWDWRSTAEYFDSLEGALGINAGFMVGHSAIRRVVMGASATHGPANSDDLAAMKRLLHDGLAAGAIGFSSSLSRAHNDADGAMVPSRYSTPEELVELCRVLSHYEGTSIEFNPCTSATPFDEWSTDLTTAMSVAAQRAVNWNALFVKADNADYCQSKLELSDHARAHGGRVIALTVPINTGARLNFRSGFVYDAVPGWEDVMLAPLDTRLAQFRDAGVRARLAENAAKPHTMKAATAWADLIIFDTFAPENQQYRGSRVSDIARDQGRPPFEALADIVVADELNTCFGSKAEEESDDDWNERLEIWRDSRTVIGASDAGAHLDLLALFNYPTVLLGRAVRERALLPLEEAVQLLTDRPARLYGLRERGRVVEGWFADLVVLDETRVGSTDLEMRYDLPGAAGRLYAEATGIDHVFCNGVAVVSGGVLTGALAGSVMRAGRDTITPTFD